MNSRFGMRKLALALLLASTGLLAAPLAAQAPPNDACANAIPLFDGANPGFTNVGATASSPTTTGSYDCITTSLDVWFTYVASCNGDATADTCSAGTNFDTKIEALSGPCGALVVEACNDDFCGLQSSITWPVMQGATYYIRVSGYSSNTGDFDVNLSCTPSGSVVAESNPYGTGCAPLGGPYASFYEMFQQNVDISGAEVHLTPNAQGGFDVQPTIGQFDGSYTNALSLGDDDLSGPQALGFSFPLPGSAAGSTTDIDICSNGFIWLVAGSSTSTDYSPTASEFLNEPERLAMLWNDLNPTDTSNPGTVYFDALAGKAMVTFAGVVEYGRSNPNTFQVQFFPTGDIIAIYQSVDNLSGDMLVGYTPGHGAADPGSMDLTASIPFSTVGSGSTALGLSSGLPLLGTNVTFTVANIPPTSSFAGILFGSQFDVTLDALGMPGCSLYSGDAGSFPVSIATGMSNPIFVPNDTIILGAPLYLQGLAVEPSVNPFGMITSNGLELIFGNM